jgi:purine-nucleoside phosphorylase
MQLTQQLEKARKHISGITEAVPEVGLVLGSGLGDMAKQIAGVQIPYSEIEGFPRATAPSHKGVLHIGDLSGKTVAAFQGRFHLYEGHSPPEVTRPVELLAAMGVKTIILTNVSGSLNPEFEADEIISISDHIFFPGLMGQSPLTGRGEENGRNRFVDLSRAYDADLLNLVDKAPGGRLQRGIYACLGGPQFETPAEGRMLRQMGVDVVGMSTVPEVIMARYLGLRVLALSLIVNPVITDPERQSATGIEEIWDIITKARGRLENRIKHVVSQV